jgi:2-iminobutanoate/2-iminopropanoate deaminase
MKFIETNKAPAAIGPYSQAVVVGGMVYTSGQIPLVPESGLPQPGGIKEQTHQAIKNIIALLEAAGSDISCVIKTTCYLTDMGDFAAFNEVYAGYFTEKPARSCVEVSALPKGVKVEIEAVAAVSS